jgi:Na+-driven multidrug efflux pump
MALPSLLISALNGILASISESGVIILGIYYKLQTFLYLSVNGMIQGMRPLMGYNYGAKEYRRVNKIYRLALTIAIGIMTAGTLLFMFTPETFIKMFTTQETTIAAGASALRIISCGFIVSSVSVVSSGALEALGKGNESLVVSLLRYLVIIVPLAFVLSRFIGANGVWHSFWITETVTAFVAYGIYQKALRNK